MTPHSWRRPPTPCANCLSEWGDPNTLTSFAKVYDLYHYFSPAWCSVHSTLSMHATNKVESEAYMTKAKALANATPLELIKVFANDTSERNLNIIHKFQQRQHHVPMGVVNACVAYCLLLLDGEVPNESYFRQALESWKAEGIMSTAVAIQKLDDSLKIVEHMVQYEKGDAEFEPMIKAPAPVRIDPEVDEMLDDLYNKMR